MKKLMAILVLLPIFSVPVYGSVKYNNEPTDISTFTRTYNGELMLEARKAFDIMGFQCNWDNNTKAATFENYENKVLVAMYSNQIYVNNQLYNSNSLIENDTLYIPVNLLQQIGLSIDWDFDEKALLINSGTQQTEINNSNDVWDSTNTHFIHNDTAVTGENYINGLMYSFDRDGTLHSGIYRDGFGVVRGYNEMGFPYYGFVVEDNKTYYFKDGTAVYTSPGAINGKMYNFTREGYFITGWYTSDGVKHYNNAFGYPVEGVVEIDGIKYLFVNGVMQVGEQTYNNKKYFLYNDGVMVTNKIMGDYYYDVNGEGVQASPEYLALMNTADNILKKTGTDTRGIYSYVASHVKYKFTGQLDWTTMATNSFKSGRGACYNFAACMDILMKRAGYETRVVRGTGRGSGLHYWNQVKINGVWTNIDACNKYYNVTDGYLKRLNYTFNTYEYPEYK